MSGLSELMPSGSVEPYEADTFGSKPELIKGGRRRKSRGKKSGKKSRKSRRKTRGGNKEKAHPMGAGNTYIGGKRRKKTNRNRR